MADFRTIRFEQEGGVATITLSRPEANALDLQMAKELAEVAIACDEDASVRAVILTGAGRFFCAGGDLPSFASHGDDMPRHMKEVTLYLHGAVSRFARMDPPLVGAVNGVAAGAGMSLACMCDLVLAAESARFTMAYTKAGLTPDGSSSYFLPRIVGAKRALELALTNRMLSAAEARDWGLVAKIVPDAELAAEARALAERFAAGSKSAFGGTKRLFQGSFGESLETQMELEARQVAEAGRGEDGREGIAAFRAKRPPRFAGTR